ncbi:phospholipid-translocating P-type ATPase, flippase family protein [Trichomonas vaginalis G3]|uniref:Phospholipid-transporting ATPase n=1 Tax=Trichomonas vaginalis (strain ATCC PRA-98 / G3) TaxID=412133 RepID=A2F978_TRIV3|nr:putative phospholipid-transporting ATPase family [Trichomonas vaginalis G3]EAX98556.1 phospholipid-translocating P-type ATPase, flippase family protein [Trichomonas vaginalis G3]KAI5553055.1 putative phospholipid-transporting ATPase family [Trichomonas vaginalis G3]|eukprot:XP_001311486.1 phospholipid-translocating P-type ATPase, flippase family protein [Trichomonas vaginalis G3]
MTEQNNYGQYSFNIGDTEFPKGIQADNYVKTTRYSLFSFIPLTLYENFNRFANIYFLIMAILGFMPWSPISPVVQIAPLIFVTVVSMVKALIEDLMRFLNDQKYNNFPFEVWRDGRFVKLQSWKIKPGDIIKIESCVEMPADIAILATSEKGGECYANEVNLNGETAIKQRKALFSSAQLSPEEAGRIHGTITISLPNKDIQRVNGTFTVNNNQFPFSIHNCILRGVFLKNTSWTVGLCLYTGHDTRIIQNQRHPPHKTSQLEKRLNKIIIFDFILNFSIVLFLTIMDFIYEKKMNFYWVKKQTNLAYFFFQEFTAYAILLSYMIPISLYVTIEFIRLFQSWTFSKDFGMYEPGLGFCSPKNSNLNEELGVIDHVFSDKTGTLTENKMSFVQMSVRGDIYDTLNQIDLIKSKISTDENLSLFLQCLGLCHSVIVSSEGYSSESPDEEALVTHTAKLGVKLISRVSDESITVEIDGTETIYDHLASVAFTSARKRMSVVVRTLSNDIYLFMKGADAMMMNLLKNDEDKSTIDLVNSQITSFAEQGLRTLVLGYRKLDKQEYTNWKERLQNAAIELENREENIARVGSEIEHSLTLLGAVAIEDELQPYVAETVAYLARMDVRFWVLTGDKKETAVSIAKSTNVITPSCSVFEILEGTEEETNTALEGIMNARQSVAVISPDGLENLIENNPKKLVEIGDLCRSVVCFRMSPFLKSRVVAVVRENTDRVCLSIGDGANDVNMIQTAHVGIGIFGREGHQAASNSDFAITRFKHLKRLMVCHGRLSLLRLSGVILYMITKNIVLIFPQIWYSIMTRWTPTTIYDDFLLSTFNLVWTIFPPVEYGWFEQDLSFKSMMSYPYLYKEARAGRYLSIWRFSLEFVSATYQSVVLFLFNVYFPSRSVIDGNGDSTGYSTAGFTLFVSVVMCMNIQVIMRTHGWTLILFLAVYLSIFVFYLFTLPYGSLSSFAPSMFFVPQTVFRMPIAWLEIIISIIAGLIPEALFRILKSLWYPSYSRIVRESEQLAYDGLPLLAKA